VRTVLSFIATNLLANHKCSDPRGNRSIISVLPELVGGGLYIAQLGPSLCGRRGHQHRNQRRRRNKFVQ
jgi:hypothetical protein